MSITSTQAALALSEILMTHGAEGTNVTGFPNIGTFLIFGVILVPVYVMLAAWFLGKPRDLKTALLGCGIFFGLIIGLWVAMFLQMELVGILFY
ncbi:hypothetical protein OB905_01920 [Halobacteria archaeon AArc-dxtr1]|nr:hypothetical protein [Halobacteria archaeon AArc-dxtr1]